jgi:hypothetical protein
MKKDELINNYFIFVIVGIMPVYRRGLDGDSVTTESRHNETYFPHKE